MGHDNDDGALRGVLNRLWSRDRLDDLHRVALTVPDPDDAALVAAAADMLLDIRHAHRGGRRDIRGSRHWTTGQ